MMIRRRMENCNVGRSWNSGGGHSLFGKLVFLVFELNSDQAIVIGWLKSFYFLNAGVCIFWMQEFVFSECLSTDFSHSAHPRVLILQEFVFSELKSSFFLNARVRIFWMQEFVFSKCLSADFAHSAHPRVLILSRASEFIIILCSPHSTIEGPRELSQNRTRTPANKIGFRRHGKVSRSKEIICCQIHKNICCLISANTLQCIIFHRFIYPCSDKSVLVKSMKCYGTVFEQILSSKKSLSMFEQILNAELAGIWTKVELDLTFPLQ